MSTQITANAAGVASAGAASLQRARWLKTLHQWHWVSAAIALIGLVLFSITGITLNHAAIIEAKPRVAMHEALLPEAMRAPLAALAEAADEKEPPAVPEDLRRWLASELNVEVQGREVEWAPDEVYIALPRPGGDAWLRIGLPDGHIEHEVTTRGFISYLNDLHKGRHAGLAWSWFLDLFAAAALVFSVTGLLILQLHARARALVWPVTALGLVLPVLLALLLVH